MTTLTINTVCEKSHTPHVESISRVIHSYDDESQFTFCESCEQNIERSCFYDDDRGTVWTRWAVSK